MDGVQMYLTAGEQIAEFSATVVGLPGEKKSAIWEMGFGPIQNIGCAKLFQQVCATMLHNIDPLNHTVEIHGRTLPITAIDFARVMGIKDGGVDIECRGEMNDSVMSILRTQLGGSNGGGVTRSSLKNVVLHREVVDSIFRVAFVMYSLSAVMCPSKETEVDERLMLTLMQTGSIRGLNWATYCFNKMMDSVLTMKLMEQGGKYVCMLFLQLYYFDAIGSTLGWVEEGTLPIMFWGHDKVGHLMGWIARQVESSTKQKRLDSGPSNCGPKHCLCDSGKEGSKYEEAIEQLKIAISELEFVKTQMRELNSRVGRIEPLIEQLSDVADRITKEMSSLNGEAMKKLVGEILNHLQPLTHENPNLIVPEMGPTEVKSNSAHFNGGNIANVGGQSSGDYSLRFLYTNPPKNKEGKGSQENDGKFANDKALNVALSDCSVSPGAPPKNSRRGRKEKKKRTPVVAPKTIVRALFKTRANTGANVRPAIRGGDQERRRGQKIKAGPFLLHGSTKQDDIDLLDFIFMERTTDDMYSSALVAAQDGMEISRKEIQCLGPGNLVCNMVINTFAAYLNKPASGYWFLPTFFQICSRGKGPDMSTREWIAHTKTSCRLHRFAGQIKTCLRVFIPLREDAENEQIAHWYLLVVNIGARYAEILDSSPTESKKVSRMQAARLAMSMLDFVFGDDIVAYGGLETKIGSLPFRIGGSSPRQPNGVDCGVFVIKNMQRYGWDWAAKYDSNTQRASLVLECVRHPRNEVAGLNEMVQQALGLWRGSIPAI